MADKFAGYDDAIIVLGDGVLDVSDALHGVEKVAGSRSCVRDPRLSALVDKGRGSSRPEKTFDSRIEKWCYICGHTRPKSYFSPDKRSWDGLDARCKECENLRKRQKYQVSVNHEVRPYHRRGKVAV